MTRSELAPGIDIQRVVFLRNMWQSEWSNSAGRMRNTSSYGYL
jgi:hypothetical protein